MLNGTSPSPAEKTADASITKDAANVKTVEKLKEDITDELSRIKRAFYTEKSSIHDALAGLKATATLLEQSVVTLEKKFEAFKADLQTSTEVKFDGIAQTQEQKLEEVRDTFERELDGIKTELNTSLINSLTEFQTAIAASSETIVDQLTVALQVSDSCRNMNEQCGRHFHELSTSVKELQANVYANDGYAYPQHKDVLHSMHVAKVRLANITQANNMLYGRVEVLHDLAWGTVCDDDFGNVDASVVCRMFGFSSGQFACCAAKGQGETHMPIWMDDITCDGNEDSLTDCSFPGYGQENCSHGEDVAVKCTI